MACAQGRYQPAALLGTQWRQVPLTGIPARPRVHASSQLVIVSARRAVVGDPPVRSGNPASGQSAGS